METPIDTIEFEWFFPIPPKPELAITIPNEKCFNLNQNLCSRVPKRITIGVSKNGKIICLKEEPEMGFRIPKSGTIQDMNLIDSIKRRGIKLPARYLVEQNEGRWIATLVLPIVPSRPPKKTPKKVRKNGLGAMLQKEGDL
jgi:hypothetical protein